LRNRIGTTLFLLAAAAVSGAVLSTAYAPRSWNPISFVALIPLFYALFRRERSRRQYFWAGYLFGVAFFLLHLYWITDLIPASSITLPWIMVPALLLLAAYLSIYPGLALVLTRVVTGGRLGPSLFVLPACWALVEALRSSGELGFPWGAIGYSLVGAPPLIQSASWIGVFGLGAIVVAVNMLLAAGFLASRPRAKLVFAVAAGAIVAALFMGGRRTIAAYSASTSVDLHRVAVVQPNVDLALKWQPTFKDSTFRLIDRLAREADRVDPELIVFPETCATTYIRRDPPHFEQLQSLARELGAAIYIGFLDAEYYDKTQPPDVFNSSGVFLPNGDFAKYDKRHLLPFGEMIPLAWRFRALARINFGQANFHPGSRVDPVPSPVGPLAPMICFEAIFSGNPRRFVKDGAQVLLNITNDGWFGRTQGPTQHANLAILRAVENRRFMLRSANTGISMVVDPVGRKTISLGLSREGIITETIHPVSHTTFYTRFGDLPVVLGALALVVAGGLMARLRVR